LIYSLINLLSLSQAPCHMG